jgi:hypothetical protein
MTSQNKSVYCVFSSIDGGRGYNLPPFLIQPLCINVFTSSVCSRVYNNNRLSIIVFGLEIIANGRRHFSIPPKFPFHNQSFQRDLSIVG